MRGQSAPMVRRRTGALIGVVGFVALIGAATYAGGPRSANTPSGASQRSEDRPNIVLLFSDDHAAHALSAYRRHLAYGAPLPPTPRLDRLAAEGMLFVDSFVSNSICVPGRAAVLTGQYGHLTGVMTNQDPLHPSAVTFPSLLRDAGYRTALFGKWHLRIDPMGFDHYEILSGQGRYYNPVLHTPGDSARHLGYTPDIITERALAWLEERDDEAPFLLLIHHNASHRYWDPSYAQVREELQRRLAALRQELRAPQEDPVPHEPFAPPPELRRPGASIP